MRTNCFVKNNKVTNALGITYNSHMSHAHMQTCACIYNLYILYLYIYIYIYNVYVYAVYYRIVFILATCHRIKH